jgi:hypothetical protein
MEPFEMKFSERITPAPWLFIQQVHKNILNILCALAG